MEYELGGGRVWGGGGGGGGGVALGGVMILHVHVICILIYTVFSVCLITFICRT